MDSLRLVAATLIVSLWLVACGEDRTAPQPTVLRFGYDNWPGYYPALIAAEEGFFAEQGVRVECTKHDNSDALLADFAAGRYDAVGISLGDIVNLYLVIPDIRVILVTNISDGGDAVLVRADIQSIEQLKGKNFGVNLGSFAELFVVTVLEIHGLSPADLRLIDTDAAEIPAKLKSGELDAGHTWEPFVSEGQADGARVLFTSTATPGLIQDVVAVRGEVARRYPNALRAFIKGWFKAVDHWKAHPARGNAVAAMVLNVEPTTISLQGMRLTTLADNLALFRPGETTASVYHTVRLYVNFFVGAGGLIRKPDVHQILDPQFLK